MGPALFYGLEAYILDTYKSTDQIVMNIVPNAPNVFAPGARWRGRLRGNDLYVTGEKQFKPTAVGTNTGHVIATIPNRSYDAAIKTYGTAYDAPGARSAKGVLATEVEAWVKIIESKYLWAATFDAIA